MTYVTVQGQYIFIQIIMHNRQHNGLTWIVLVGSKPQPIPAKVPLQARDPVTVDSLLYNTQREICVSTN